MSAETKEIVLLNWLASRSATKSRTHEVQPEPASVLFEILHGQFGKGWAIEYEKQIDEKDEEVRKKIGFERRYSYTRLADFKIKTNKDFKYVCLFLKYVDTDMSAFPVEDMEKFTGSEVSGGQTERGVTAVHLVARLPIKESQFDDARYRCVLEAKTPLNRGAIEHFLCRQLRRVSDQEDRSVTVVEQKGRRKVPTEKQVRYTPRLELHSDVGRTTSGGVARTKELTQMVFTKVSARHSTGKQSEIKLEDFTASIEYKVSANQGPNDPEEKVTWAESIKDYFTGQGFESRLYYRHMDGSVVSGKVHQDIAGAHDLLICPREVITLSNNPKASEPAINEEVVTAIRGLLDDDELWERSK